MRTHLWYLIVIFKTLVLIDWFQKFPTVCIYSDIIFIIIGDIYQSISIVLSLEIPELMRSFLELYVLGCLNELSKTTFKA